MRNLKSLSALAIAAASLALLSANISAQTTLQIKLAHNSATEQQTGDQLERLLKTYDVSPWLYTKSIIVDDTAIPHSHPVLTLHTRHLRDDALLLSTVVHEQFHWFLVQKDAQMQEAVKELRTQYPSVPPEGANGEQSTYLHLLVCYLEWGADERVLGELAARQVIEFWSTDHYPWVYTTLLHDRREIGQIVSKHGLIPR
jgi:hypothetical protein